MKLPELPKRAPKAPKASSSSRSSLSSVKAPAFLEDLYKDMRDRRLIIPAIVLLIAIIAVPVMLSESADTTVNVPAPVDDPSAIAVEPAVLAVQEVGVRDFRERLDALKRKNPFGDRFAVKEDETDTAGDLLDPEAGTPDGTPVTDPAATGTSPVDSPSTTPSEPTDPVDPPDPPEPFVLVPRVDVVVGVVGRDRRETMKNVKSGDLLPSRDVPVALYLGNSDDSESAEFLVSRDVDQVKGEGECRPSKNSCEFLRLGKGETASLSFADGKRYLIKVTSIFFEKVDADKFDQDE